jgi:hypothetical protein
VGSEFSIGDHVQVTELFPHETSFRSATGTFVPTPDNEHCKGQWGEYCWVQFDTPIPVRHERARVTVAAILPA